MRLKIIGIVETIQAQRDEDAALPQRARVGLRLVGEANKAAERLELKTLPVDAENESLKRLVVMTEYSDAQELSVGDEIVIVAFTRTGATAPGQCGWCGAH